MSYESEEIEKTRKVQRRLKYLANIIITNKGYFQYLTTVERLAVQAACAKRDKRKSEMERLRKFLENASILMDLVSHEDFTDEQMSSIQQSYELELAH